MAALVQRCAALVAILALANLQGSAGVGENPLLRLLRQQAEKKHHSKNPLALLGRRARGSMPMELNRIMAASQLSLAKAEAHHEKVVKQSREKLNSLLHTQAGVLGGAIGQYAAVLDRAEAGLAQAANSTKNAMEKVHLRGSASSWGGPDVEAKARLGAKVQAAEREARRLSRQQPRAVREAESEAESLLEDSTQPLSRKLGDLTEALDSAKTSLQSAETSAKEAAATPDTAVKAAPNAKPANVTFDVLEQQLAAAKNGTTISGASAKSQLDTVVKQVTKDVEKGVAGLQKELEDAQRSEIESVHSGPATEPKAKAKANAKAKAAPAQEAKKTHKTLL